MPELTVVPVPGFSPGVGRLVSMMAYARATTLQAVEGLTTAELDHRHDERSNSIGALLAHVAAVEWWYQLYTFERREPDAAEEREQGPALDLGPPAWSAIRGWTLEQYIERLERVRERTLSELARVDDAWLDLPDQQPSGESVNRYWQWFHVLEDELSHRGQIRWLRSRLPG
jgi:uncharacterized damage-inducible protein DinB